MLSLPGPELELHLVTGVFGERPIWSVHHAVAAARRAQVEPKRMNAFFREKWGLAPGARGVRVGRRPLERVFLEANLNGTS